MPSKAEEVITAAAKKRSRQVEAANGKKRKRKRTLRSIESGLIESNSNEENDSHCFICQLGGNLILW